MNYAELTAAIQNYTENTFTSVELATFVEQAEQRIYNTVQFPSLRKNVTGSMESGNKYLACPTDFLSPHSVAVIQANGSYVFLLDKDVNYIRQIYPNPTSTGTPKYYAIFGPTSVDDAELSFILGPTPDAAYSVELHYYYYPESIVTAGQSWLGDNIDSVLLYGSLVEAYTFMKGEADLLQLYELKYNQALALAKRLGDGLEKQDSYRSGQARVSVT
tara:strand:- start:1331 stop:1981 length:651 start_codon:yes stop_codon:yes gene_type:complete